VKDFNNAGQECQPKGQPEEVRSHDFEDKKPGKAIPYGMYDINQNNILVPGYSAKGPNLFLHPQPLV